MPTARSAGGVRRLAGRATLAELTERICECRACPRLVAWREQVAREKLPRYAEETYWARPVPGFGDEHPRIVVMGLAPAAHGGNRTGRNFTGDASATWLFAALHRAGLARLPTSEHADDGQELYGVRLLNPVRCAPPANRPTAEEIATCSPWARRELELLLPTTRVVLALGAIGWQAALTALELPRTRFGHGVELRSGDLTLLGSYHPSPHNTNTHRLTEAMMDDLLARAKSLAFEPAPVSQRQRKRS